ncbi:hypothetical protein CCP3SC1AL1_890016 [Gammaproteobacteria bacterium]|jgi:hypothetical protein
MNREKLNLTSEQGRDIVYGDDSNFVTIEDKIVGKRRWSIEYEIVVQRKSDGKYFKDGYCRGATENQDESPYEWSEPNFKEVFPVTKTYIDYE